MRGLRTCLRLAAVVLALASTSDTPLIASSQDGRARAQQLAALADAAAAEGRVAQAVSLLEQAERAAPDWPELKVNLAAARSRAGDYEGAAAAARAALALDPWLDGARFNLGLALLKSGDAAEAAVVLAPYADVEAPPAVHAALGLAWLQMDRPAEAAPVLQRAIDGRIRDRDTLLAAGRAWIAAGNLEHASAALRALEIVASSWVDTYLLAGDIADATDDWTAAEEHYRAALERDPQSAQAHYSLGLVLYKQRDYDRAASAFTSALGLAPEHVPGHHFLGLLELDRGNAARAAALLRRAAELAPARSDVARDLGRALIDIEELPQAIGTLERAVELDRDDPSAWFLLGRARKLSGDNDGARAAFARSTQLNQRLRERLERRVSGVKKSPDSR